MDNDSIGKKLALTTRLFFCSVIPAIALLALFCAPGAYAEVASPLRAPQTTPHPSAAPSSPVGDKVKMLLPGYQPPGSPSVLPSSPPVAAKELLPEPVREAAQELPKPLVTAPTLPPAEPSPIEQSMTADEGTIGKAASHPVIFKPPVQFGFSFFREGAPGFAPLTDIPVGPEYVIGPGDRIVLNAWGSLEGNFELEVNRSGEIVLPRVGAVKVWGVTYDRLPQVIRTALSRVYKDFETNVTMGKLKLIKVYVVGEVRSPGDYNLSSLSTVMNALAAAGGPAKSGSLRTVQVKRGGKVVETVDLYDFFLKGDKSRDIRLQSGDTVFVPASGPVAGIVGNVRRPAIYELKGERTLRDLLQLADGLLPTGYLQRVQISRVDSHKKKAIIDYSLDPKEGKSLDEAAASIEIRDMDLVRIFPIDTTLRDHVRLEGYVLRPGDYALKPGMRVADLLPADNLLHEYYRQAGEIIRRLPPEYQPEKIIFNAEAALAGDPRHNLELREFDTVKLFSRWEMEEMPKVRISGEVQKPGEYRLFKAMTVRDLLLTAGNVKQTAYLKNAEINRLKRTGEKVTAYPVVISLEEALRENPEHNLSLAPFDELIVRRIPNWSEETDRYVTLKGEVMFPGTYPVYKGERLSSVIERAGGFTDKAYLRGAKFARQVLQAEQQKRMEEVLSRTQQEIAKKQVELTSVAASKEELEATKASLDGLQRTVELLKGTKAEGRLVIRITRPADLKNTPNDVELLGGDILEVPQTPGWVSVMGQVYNPTSVIQSPGADVAYYLKKAGGPNKEADQGEMYIIRADGSVQSRQATPGFLFFGGFMSAELDPGDTLVVPQRIEKIAWMREIKDIATILGQLAITAGVVVAAGL